MARNVSFFAPQQLGPANPLAAALGGYGQRPANNPLAAQALSIGTDASPVSSPLEGVTRLGQALLGGWMMGNDRRRGDEAAGRLADQYIGSLPEAERGTPRVEAIRSMTQDPDLRPLIAPSLAEALMPRRQEPPAGYRLDAQGNLTPVPGGPADPNVQRQQYLINHPITMGGDTPYDTAALLGGAGGAAGPSAAPGAPAAPPRAPGAAIGALPATGDAQVDAALAQLQAGESGGDPRAQPRDPRTGQPIVDAQGRPLAYGLYQFTPDTWQGVAARHPELGLTPAGIADPQQQQRAAQAHARDILQRFQPYVGRQFNGVTITPDMLIRGAWIGGEAGLQRFLESGGQRNPRDVFGTSIGDYFAGTARNLRPLQAAQPGQSAAAPAPSPSRLRGQAVPGALPIGDDAPDGATAVPLAVAPGAPQPRQVAQAPGAASDAGAAPPDVRAMLPDRRGQVAGLSPPRMEPGGIMAAPRPGALVQGPTRDQIATAREIRNSHLGQPQVRDTQRIVNVLSSMEDAVARNSAASDLNLVYGLMTILDPGSVVREGETVMVNGTQSVPQQLQGLINRVLNGEAALGPEGRQAIMAEARSRASGQIDAYNWLRDNDEDFLAQNGYRPDAVLGRRLALPAARRPPQPPGAGGGSGAGAATPPPPSAAEAQAELERRRRAQGAR